MTLIDCPECEQEVSSAAVSCPNCGHPLGFEGADLVRHLQAQQAAREDAGLAGFNEPPVSGSDDRTTKQKTWAWVTLATGIGLTVGSLLPWATLTAPFVGTLEVTATDGDGIITLIAGLVIGLFGIVGLTRGVGIGGLVVLILALGLCAAVAVIDLGNVTDMVAEIESEDFGAASVGSGLWIVTIATVVGFVGWVGLLTNRR